MSASDKIPSLETSTHSTLGIVEEEPRLSHKRDSLRILVNNYLHHLDTLTGESATARHVEHFNQLKDRMCSQQTQIALGALAVRSPEVSWPQTISETALLHQKRRSQRLYEISTRNGNTNGHRPTKESFEMQFYKSFNAALPELEEIEQEAQPLTEENAHVYFRLDNVIRTVNQPLFDYEAVHAGLLTPKALG